MRVTMHATTAASCGVADYARDLVAGLGGTVNVKVVPIPGRGVNPLPMLALARRLSRADLTHIQHNYGFWGRGTLSYRVVFQTLQRAIRVPVVLTPHSVFPRLPREWDGTVKRAAIKALGLYEFMDRGTFQFADRIIVHSRHHLRLLVERGVPREQLVEVMPGAPEVARPAPAEVARYRSTWGLEGKRVLGVFGFIQPNKNYELVVRALAQLPGDIALLLVGGVRTAGEEWYGRRLEELVTSLGVEGRVRMTGFLPREHLAQAMSAVDLFVLPYVADHSVSYSARLCLAYEKPLLASAVEAFEELREQYGCVELLKSDDPVELAAHVLALLEDPERRAALAERARTYCRQRSWRRVAEETLGVYQSVLGHPVCASSC